MFILIATSVHSQQKVNISLKDFLERVRLNNLEYAAEKLNINIADAAIESAKVFNDPNVSIGYGSAEIYGMKMGSSIGVEVSKTISYGKRSAAIEYAMAEKELTKILLDDYFHNLRAYATSLWIDVIKRQRLYDVQMSTYQMVRELVAIDSLRQVEGWIGETDMTQSRVEAGIMYNELLNSEAELQHSYLNLTNVCGVSAADSIIIPSSNVIKHSRVFNLIELIKNAPLRRPDILAAAVGIDLSEKGLRVAKASNNLDIDIAIGMNLHKEAKNEIAPSPFHRDFSVSLSIPIPISTKLYNGEIKSASIKVQQSELKYKSLVQSMETEIIDSYNNYFKLDKQLKSYSNGLLLNAKNVLDEKKTGYRKGDTPFLEVLDAQRTYDSVLIMYFETMYNKSEALVKLEKAAGIWDIE
ncbi:hypothetical protein SDC9_96784 [bioreactor metagenome]|uniref:Cobalt-zinc-cadmium resistance protein CzcC n=1 Tax=bioreactor metagenome TaxID=1076179 RepID=A0A645AA23_9ZZZZ